MSLRCRLLGHRWTWLWKVLGAYSSWQLLGVTCFRCEEEIEIDSPPDGPRDL